MICPKGGRVLHDQSCDRSARGDAQCDRAAEAIATDEDRLVASATFQFVERRQRRRRDRTKRRRSLAATEAGIVHHPDFGPVWLPSPGDVARDLFSTRGVAGEFEDVCIDRVFVDRAVGARGPHLHAGRK
jgi:hypothetical protein